MSKDRPQIVIREHDHGCLITVLLLIVAWPLAILYWILRLIAWAIRSAIDWLTLGPLRRRR